MLMNYKKQYKELYIQNAKLEDENSNLKNKNFDLMQKVNELSNEVYKLSAKKNIDDLLYKKIVEISELPNNIENLRLFYDFIKIYKGIS